MSDRKLVSTSKFLSLVLRHRPEVIGMELDHEGWLPIAELIENAGHHGKEITLDLIHEVVSTNDKQRFALSEDGLRIRANQGHSVADVDLNLEVSLGDNSLFPRLRTDLIVDWEFVAGQSVNQPSVDFQNVQLNLGDFFSGFAGELLNDVQGVLDGCRVSLRPPRCDMLVWADQVERLAGIAEVSIPQGIGQVRSAQR